jgi:glycosyltransferase involved in cell wall biosynthesis
VLGADKIFFGQWTEMKETVKKINPQILHLNRGTHNDFFTAKLTELPKELKIVETNIFAKHSSEDYWSRLNQSYFVSQYCLDKSPWHGGKGKVLYNPIKARLSTNSLREAYNIPPKAIVLGQIGRPDLPQDDWIYQAYRQNKSDEVYLCVLGCTQKIKELKTLDDKIILIEATTDAQLIDQFFNTIDVLLHRRFDGETFGMNIAEAMIYGKPVVSHRSSVDNAQAELLDAKEFGLVGFVTQEEDRESYFHHVHDLIAQAPLRQSLGQNASKKALQLYEASVVTKKLQDCYLEVVDAV